MRAMRKRISNKIEAWCKCSDSHIEVVKVLPMEAAFNHRCHENACNVATLNPRYEVIEGFYKQDSWDGLSLHYWVYDTLTKQYYDPSIGYMSKVTTYYKIRTINTYDYTCIVDIFTEQLKEYKKKFTNPIERLFLWTDGGRIL